MFNAKKISMMVTASILGLALTGCGKDNYNGNYSGTEIKMPATQTGQTGQTGQPGQPGYYPTNNYYNQQQSYRGVTAELHHDGEIVTGTYNITPNQYGGVQSQTTSVQQETYRFEANANTANQLTGVRLIPMSTSYYGGGGCVLEGNLTAVQDGRRITGTLNPTNTGYQSTNYLCGPTQITLDRAN